MSIAVHDELIESLVVLRRMLPSMRLGQLIANMATVARGAVPDAIWEAEDDELLGAIRWQFHQLASRAVSEDTEGLEKGKLEKETLTAGELVVARTGNH